MNAKKFSIALGEVNEKYVTEAIEYSGTTKLATRTHFPKALMIAAIITALLLLSAAAYAVIRYYSTTIENTGVVSYQGSRGTARTLREGQLHRGPGPYGDHRPELSGTELVQPHRRHLPQGGRLRPLRQARRPLHEACGRSGELSRTGVLSLS